MKKISITQGKEAIVDDEDFYILSMSKWQARSSRNTWYADRASFLRDGTKMTEGMHRVVLSRKIGRELLKGEKADHVNGNGLDNRRENLRISTTAQNARNRHTMIKGRSSRYLGVSWHKRDRNWQARVGIGWKAKFLGCYRTELEAALARETFITAHPELNARSNFEQQVRVEGSDET